MADGPILKIEISPYLGEKSSDFHEILYTAGDFELDERHILTLAEFALSDCSCCFYITFYRL